MRRQSFSDPLREASRMRWIFINLIWFAVQVVHISAEAFTFPPNSEVFPMTHSDPLPFNLSNYITMDLNGHFSIRIPTSDILLIPIVMIDHDVITFNVEATSGCEFEMTVCWPTVDKSISYDGCIETTECGFHIEIINQSLKILVKTEKGTSYNGTHTVSLREATLYHYANNTELPSTSCPLKVNHSSSGYNYTYIRIQTHKILPSECGLKFTNVKLARFSQIEMPENTEIPVTDKQEVEPKVAKKKKPWILVVIGVFVVVLLLLGIVLVGYCLFMRTPYKKKPKNVKKTKPKKAVPSPSYPTKPTQEASSQLPDSNPLPSKRPVIIVKEAKKEEKSCGKPEQIMASEPVMQGSDVPPTSEQPASTGSKVKISAEPMLTPSLDTHADEVETGRELNPYDEIQEYSPSPAELKLFDCRTPREAIRCLRAEIPALNAALEKLGVRFNNKNRKVFVTSQVRDRVLDPINSMLYRNRLWALEYPVDLNGTFWDRQAKLMDLSLYRLYALLLQDQLSDLAGLQLFATLLQAMGKYLQAMRTHRSKYSHPLPMFYDLAMKNPNLFESTELVGIWDSARHRKPAKTT